MQDQVRTLHNYTIISVASDYTPTLLMYIITWYACNVHAHVRVLYVCTESLECQNWLYFLTFSNYLCHLAFAKGLLS